MASAASTPYAITPSGYRGSGSAAALRTSLSAARPKNQALAPSSMSTGSSRRTTRVMSGDVSSVTIDATMGGMMNAAMIEAVAYARRGVNEARARLTPPRNTDADAQIARIGGTAGTLSMNAA